MGDLGINIPFHGDLIQSPETGHSYKSFGIEIRVENVTSDYLSDYIVIKVRPLTYNYMFDTYRYTMVDIPIGNARTVDISSGLINKTNQYTFHYAFAPTTFSSAATLIVKNSTLSKQYSAYAGLIVAEAKNDFNIEISVYKTDSDRMILYVKPLY